ncbi:phosphopantetheine-binding protein [Streptomyces sp. SP18CS02]|uniref:phosphopantetheine-binding protein n=1 Tax=Streptomyces sp. SP18CS02 TaxID=3002531 RepID=UPI002E775BFB|nr:phosphopantetheine-binding protein [Streptomyces sp. SP18CS02]MEE1752048.1 phosphopantetheine-binding protein [Streptomyces sp. SP18CS02]
MTTTSATAIKTWLIANFIPDVTPDQIDDDLDLIESGVVDSLRLLRLISWVSEHYGIPLDDVPIAPENFRTVAAIRAFVESAKNPATT